MITTPPVTLAIKSDGERYWNDEPVNAAKLDQHMGVLDARRTRSRRSTSAPTQTTKYGIINDAVQTLRKAGVRKVGFVSGPERDQ